FRWCHHLRIRCGRASYHWTRRRRLNDGSGDHPATSQETSIASSRLARSILRSGGTVHQKVPCLEVSQSENAFARIGENQMNIYAQHGHQPSDKILAGLEEKVVDGVIFSTRYAD